MNYKKLFSKILYPHPAVIICLLPVSVALLIFSLIYLDSTSILSILSYCFSFYLLVVLCVKIPNIIKYFKQLKHNNKLLKRWFSDTHLRVKTSLYVILTWNVLYAVFQLWLGFHSKSFWFGATFVYYLFLALIRFFLAKQTTTLKDSCEDLLAIKKYTVCGWLLLLLNFALATIVFFIVYLDKTFIHSEIITIVLATYTFSAFTLSIVNLVKFRKYKNPIYSASKYVSLIVACVSILTLETTMLTTFSTGNDIVFRKVILGITGFFVVAISITLSLIMIIHGTKTQRNLKK